MLYIIHDTTIFLCLFHHVSVTKLHNVQGARKKELLSLSSANLPSNPSHHRTKSRYQPPPHPWFSDPDTNTVYLEEDYCSHLLLKTQLRLLQRSVEWDSHSWTEFVTLSNLVLKYLFYFFQS